VSEEAPGLRSFYFQAADGSALPAYEPGQFLPIRLHIPGLEAPLIRTYTLSDAQQGSVYRITVKREGTASTWLHENIKAGMEIEAKAPGGAFVLDRSSGRAVVLLSAGIGITPMIAMLNSLLNDKSGRARPEHIHFIHGARRAEEHPFADELKAAERAHSNLSVHLRDSQADAGPVGRVDIEYLKSVLPFGDYDFYLCGPGTFMQDMYTGLRALNIADDRIRFEAFGPASVKRTQSAKPALSVTKPVAPRDPERSSKVVFMRTQRDAQWSPEDGSLLDFAEANGVSVASNCRSGVCGTCATRVLSGDVTYPVPCEGEIPAGHALICSAIPARMGSGEESAVVLDL
jgi:ferredoxin-NADP reductase